ncbi:hypothetical protein OPKNFCMD_4514 [Methylobacterium crusticola]|uniref:Uncharacterized protein n=1 Tax=Methylobacterium crusticola TaxID=1697972 RepID=A0ABQ4R4J4_9HYPH|nr:hypothetical protein [Methylobacterium crusticola]GJD51756.1 hypothetical protein OPKNFCMD_4514 [Methylobacterium crusticola]
MLYRRLGYNGVGMINGGNVPQLSGRASLGITLNGFPAGAKTKTSTEGMFRRVSVARSRQMASADNNGEWL